MMWEFNWCLQFVCTTLPKFNIAPEKLWLEGYFPIGKVYNFSEPMLNFGGGKFGGFASN